MSKQLGINDVEAKPSLLLTFHENPHTLEATVASLRRRRGVKIEGLNLEGFPRAVGGQCSDGFS
jgi:hypothetical protein